MSDSTSSSPKEGNSKRPPDPNEDDDQEADPKRARGPSDCLNWDSESEEEFTPFTQSSSPPKKVFAKKSAPKRVGEKKKKNRAKNSKGLSSSAKGKSIRKLSLFDFIRFN